MSAGIATTMRTIALALMQSFDADQRKAACRAFPDETERRLWFFTPTDHGGLPLGAMTPTQHRLVHQLIASGLSRAGYNTVAAIIGLDNILDRLEHFRVDFDRERGRDPLMYFVTVFGDPAGEAPWSWRFGGHHVSLHYTVAGDHVLSMTPSFFGADPADSPLLGPHLHRPLAAAEDLGRELFRSLGEHTAEALLCDTAPVDIATGNRPVVSEGDRPMGLPEVWRHRFTGPTAERLENMQANAERLLELTEAHIDAVAFSFEPKGVRVNALGADEQQILDALLNAYLERLPEELADAQQAVAASDRAHLTFAWAGSAEKHEPHYYRIQGKRLLIEYDNTQRGANHIHTVWRDLENDFAGDVLAQHYATSDHG